MAPGETPILWGRGSSTNVQKVLWTLHELEVAYEHIEIAGPFGQTDTDAFIALNPNRTVPVWQTSEITLWESQAIMRHLARTHGRLYGSTEVGMADVDRWLDWFALVYWPPVRMLFLDVFRDKKLDLKNRAAQEAVVKTRKAIELLEAQAAKHDYLTGPEFTLADIAVAIGVNRMLGLNYGIVLSPALCDWHDRVTSRPGFKRATVGEPDMPGHALVIA